MLLPAIDSPSEQTDRPSEVAANKAVQLSGNILFVDDEKMVLDVGRKMFEALEFTVYTAMDGKEAVDKVQ